MSLLTINFLNAENLPLLTGELVGAGVKPQTYEWQFMVVPVLDALQVTIRSIIQFSRLTFRKLLHLILANISADNPDGICQVCDSPGAFQIELGKPV